MIVATGRSLALLLIASSTAAAADPCPLRAGTDVTVSVHLSAPTGALVAGVTLVVDHPDEKIGLLGEGVDVPKTSISASPDGAVASVNDLGTSVRVVLARATPLPIDRPLLTLHFQGCEGAKAPEAREFSCTVSDAADPATNRVRGLGCTVTIP
ncbi:MAG: hypothetical protein ACREQL_05225 [Candidatus Binatia bacterium]